MKKEFGKDPALDDAGFIFDKLVHYGFKCFQLLPDMRVIWLPWDHEAFDLDEPRAIGHLLVMMHLMDPHIARRNRVVEYFILICERNSTRIELTDELLKQFPVPQSGRREDLIEWANRLLRHHPKAQQKKTE